MGVRRGDDQPADPGGRAERDRVRDETAEAEAEEIGLGDPQVVEQRDDVARPAPRCIGRPVSAVCPWPCSSTAITCLLAARGSSSGPKLRSMVSRPPWSSTSGRPRPWIS